MPIILIHSRYTTIHIMSSIFEEIKKLIKETGNLEKIFDCQEYRFLVISLFKQHLSGSVFAFKGNKNDKIVPCAMVLGGNNFNRKTSWFTLFTS